MYIKYWHIVRLQNIGVLLPLFPFQWSKNCRQMGLVDRARDGKTEFGEEVVPSLSSIFLGTQNYMARKKEEKNPPPNQCARKVNIYPKLDIPHCSHLIAKNVSSVMDEDPAQPPARNQPALGQPSTGQDGDIAAEVGQRLKFGVRKHLRRRSACCSCLLASHPPNPMPPTLFFISLGPEPRVWGPIPTLKHDWDPKRLQRKLSKDIQPGVWSGLKEAYNEETNPSPVMG